MAEEQRVERWMLARLDQESGRVLLEVCKATKAGTKELGLYVRARSKKSQPEAERLAWWRKDIAYRWTTREELLQQFGFAQDTDLLERMVFYVFLSGRPVPDRVVDATVLARALSKEMYDSLLHIPAPEKEGEQAGGAR